MKIFVFSVKHLAGKEPTIQKKHVLEMNELCLHALSFRRASAHLVVKTHIEEIPRRNKKPTRPCHVELCTVCSWASSVVRHSLYRGAEADTSPRVLNVWRGGNTGCPREKSFMVWLSESMWDYFSIHVSSRLPWCLLLDGRAAVI